MSTHMVQKNKVIPEVKRVSLLNMLILLNVDKICFKLVHTDL